jgi:hypothetical protein
MTKKSTALTLRFQTLNSNYPTLYNTTNKLLWFSKFLQSNQHIVYIKVKTRKQIQKSKIKGDE